MTKAIRIGIIVAGFFVTAEHAIAAELDQNLLIDCHDSTRRKRSYRGLTESVVGAWHCAFL